MATLDAVRGAINDESCGTVTAARAAPLLEAVVAGGARRFRPVLMTSLTIFAGLAPSCFETSVQAQFLIPMTLSLGFGILFATAVLVVLVPCLYLVVEDLRRGAGALAQNLVSRRQPAHR